jgi:uncharacterized membrane protein YfcA
VINLRIVGSGVVIVPARTLLFCVDMHYAGGASLPSSMATSSGAAAVYMKLQLPAELQSKEI